MRVVVVVLVVGTHEMEMKRQSCLSGGEATSVADEVGTGACK